MHFSIAPGIMSGLITLDTVPNAFSFAPISNAMFNTLYTSAAVPITGITDITPVLITSGTGEVSIAGGPWVTSGFIEYGQTVQLRVTSAGAVSITVEVTVDIGGVTGTFSTLTVAIAPDPYWANVYALIPFNGNYVDSVSGNTGTVTGTVTVDSSGMTTGTTTSYIRMPARSDNSGYGALASVNYTWEAFITMTAPHPGVHAYWIGLWGVALTKIGFASTSTVNNAPYVFWASNAKTVTGPVTVAANNGVRYHVAVVRVGSVNTMYFNGIKTGTFDASGLTGGTTYFLDIGVGGLWKIDNFRMTKGVARYTGATYTVPDSPFPAY